MTELDDDMIEKVAGFVECATYEECRAYLQKHPELIKKEVSDSLFEKAYLIWDSQPRQISARFVRNAQIIQYLLDLRKASNGQQDITLFFYRILEDKDRSFLRIFEEQVASILKHMEESWARRRAAKKQPPHDP